jgi:hypothetical protein
VVESHGQTSSFGFSPPSLLRFSGTFDTSSSGTAPAGSLTQGCERCLESPQISINLVQCWADSHVCQVAQVSGTCISK